MGRRAWSVSDRLSVSGPPTVLGPPTVRSDIPLHGLEIKEIYKGGFALTCPGKSPPVWVGHDTTSVL